MREVVIVETTEAGVAVLGRTADPELVDQVSRELAARDRRRLARLEGPRLIPSTSEPGAEPLDAA